MAKSPKSPASKAAKPLLQPLDQHLAALLNPSLGEASRRSAAEAQQRATGRRRQIIDESVPLRDVATGSGVSRISTDANASDGTTAVARSSVNVVATAACNR